MHDVPDNKTAMFPPIVLRGQQQDMSDNKTTIDS